MTDDPIRKLLDNPHVVALLYAERRRLGEEIASALERFRGPVLTTQNAAFVAREISGRTRRAAK